MSKDREYIKEKFDNDGIKAPESLSEENMLRMLEAADNSEQAAEAPAAPVAVNSAPVAEKTTAPEAVRPAAAEPSAKKEFKGSKRRMRPVERRLIAAAAACIVAVFGLGGYTALMNKAPDTGASGSELYTFRNETEIRRTVNSIYPSSSSPLRFLHRETVEDYDDNTLQMYGSDDESEMNEMPGDAGENAAAPSGDAKTLGSSQSGKSAPSHSETYLQVEDVDEADIVKTDGKYIYYVTKDKEVVILSAKNGKTEKLSVIGNSGVENYIQDIYLKGDTLVTVGQFYKDDAERPDSGIVVYDISDRRKPKAVSDFSQSGDILTSRMVGNYVYIVTNDYVQRGGRFVPMCGSSDSYSPLPASDIKCVPDPKTASYIVLSAVDISSGKQSASCTKAVFGASNEIYCNDHALYSASNEWDQESGNEYTRIARAKLDGADVSFDATTRVRGQVNDQFSMDEKDGYFRIATTSRRAGMDVNNLFILDKALKETGKVTGFARNESIKAVRFMGEKAYVITYQAIDPLFVIDLADPADPRIEGEVKIDGFSTLLVPLGGGRLLGIGHATGDNGYGGEYASGLKLALFDISDPSAPKVLDSKEYEDMSSPAQSDHHALTVNTEDGYFAIPYDIYHYLDVEGGDDVVTIEDDLIIEDAESAESSLSDAEDADSTAEEPQDSHEAGVLVFSAGDKISTIDQHALEASQLFRSVCIDGWIYALDAKGEVYSFRPAL